MADSKKNAPQSPFDLLIGELVDDVEGRSPLDLCLSGDRKAIAAIPLRYRLIALGFVQHLSLEEVNTRLTKNGCERLYARSLREASLIYAFRNGLSYDAWRALEADCAEMRTSLLAEAGLLSSAALSLADIRAYVGDNSLRKDELARTQHKTRLLSRAISEISGDREKFREFLLSNLLSFSPVREKTRYYFCKYLLYYLETKEENYLGALEAGRGAAALDHLSVFRIRTALSRKKYPAQEAAAMIEESPLSFGEIYRAFQEFYFEMTSSDWLEIQLEYYGDLRSLDTQEARALSAALRHRDPRLKRLSDREVIAYYADLLEKKEEMADERFAADNKKAAYQTGRSGENFLRKVLRGETDLDRTTFLAFLLFFGKEGRVPKEHRIDPARLTQILGECGFPPLDPSSGFDRFFRGFMGAKDPVAAVKNGLLRRDRRRKSVSGHGAPAVILSRRIPDVLFHVPYFAHRLFRSSALPVFAPSSYHR